MDISSLSSASLRSVIGLVEKREKLLAEIAGIEGQITKTLGDGGTPWKTPLTKLGRKPNAQPLNDGGYGIGNGLKPGKARKTGRRGGLKAKVLAELEAAGKGGASVKDIAGKLGVKSQNVHVWFATTGKKLTKKVSPGVYALA